MIHVHFKSNRIRYNVWVCSSLWNTSGEAISGPRVVFPQVTTLFIVRGKCLTFVLIAVIVASYILCIASMGLHVDLSHYFLQYSEFWIGLCRYSRIKDLWEKVTLSFCFNCLHLKQYFAHFVWIEKVNFLAFKYLQKGHFQNIMSICVV